MQTERKEFSLEYIEKELAKLEKTIETPVEIYVAGGYVIAYQKLKAATKDIDVIIETSDEVEILVPWPSSLCSVLSQKFKASPSNQS